MTDSEHHQQGAVIPLHKEPNAASTEAAREAFKLWLATPSAMRTIKSQRELSEHLGVHYNTLTRWRQEKGFQESVNQIVYEQLRDAIREVKSGRVEFKVDKGAIIHVPFGKASFEQVQLAENLASLVDAVNRAKPAGAKGQYLRTLTIASTMGPGVRVDIPAVLAAAQA